MPYAKPEATTKPMKIAFFTNNYKPFVGGVPIAVENLAKGLRRRGHRVLIYAPEYEGEVADEPDVYRVLSIKNFNSTPFSLPLPLTVRPHADLADLEFLDIVHVHHPFLLGMTGLQLARAQHVPVVFTYHTQYEKYTHYLPFPEKMTAEIAVGLSTRFCNCCDTVIAPSSDIRKTLEERGVKVPIEVIPTGIDLRAFRGGSPAKFRGEVGTNPDTTVVLTVSRLAREKNISFLIRAFADFHRIVPQSEYWLVGEGDARSELEELAQELGVGDCVRFLGTLRGKRLVSAYKAANLFVFASTTETQGLVVAEAMVAGLPVVAVEAPGVRDIVLANRGGFLVPEGDFVAFVQRMIQLIQNPLLWREISEEAKKRGRQFSITATVDRVERLYTRLIKSPPTPAKIERFMLLREFLRYHFEKFVEEVDRILP